MAARALPFFVFVLLTSFQGKLGATSEYWLYALKTVVGAWLVWSLRGAIPEMRWTFSIPALLAGLGVVALWVGLEGYYPPLSTPGGRFWNPHEEFGQGSLLAWGLIGIRLLGVTLIVPPIEEAFYRSLFYRAVERHDFLSMSLSHFVPKGFFVTSIVFGLVHPREWLPAIVCGMVYQGLVLRRGHLGDSMTAHGITNLLLGLYVVWKGAWQFW